jgi:hypothetical protein
MKEMADTGNSVTGVAQMTEQDSYSISRSGKSILLMLAIIYLLGALAAFVTVLLLTNSPNAGELRSKLLIHGFRHAFVFVLCGGTYVLAVCRNKLARVACAFAVGITGLAAIKVLFGLFTVGFTASSLIEPVIILPCVFLLMREVLRR